MAARKSYAYCLCYLQRAPAKSFPIRRSLIPPFRHFSKKTPQFFLNKRLKYFFNKAKEDIPSLDSSSYLSYFKDLFGEVKLSGGHQQSMKFFAIQILNISKKPDFLKALKEFLENDGNKLTASFLSRFMVLYSETDALDKKEVVQNTYLQIDNPTFCLNNGFIATAFAQVDDWAKCEELLDLCDIALDTGMVHSPTIVNIYSNVLMVAIKQNNPEQFFLILKRLMSKFNELPTEKVISAYFTRCKKKKSLFNAVDLLELIKGSKWIAREETEKTIYHYFHEHEQENWICNYGYVDGLNCSVCNHRLEENEITNEEFQTLREIYYKKVIQGTNIFRTTTKEELMTFEKFMHKHGPFDVICDGLNINHVLNQTVEYKGSQLIDFLNLFENKKILVILRESCSEMMQILSGYKGPNTVAYFIADHLSKDDIFFTYGAFLSGKDAIIVSNDFLRDAMARLLELSPQFHKWQLLNHIKYHYDGNEFQLRKPVIHKHQLAKDENGWHIPYVLQNIPVRDYGTNYHPVFHICLRRKKDKD